MQADDLRRQNAEKRRQLDEKRRARAEAEKHNEPQARQQAFGRVLDQAGGKVIISITNRHLPEIIADAWQAELSTPTTAESLFVRDGRVVRLARGRRGAVRIVEVSQAALKNRLVQIAEWVKTTATVADSGETTFALKPAGIPRDIPGMMLEAPHADLPELEAVINTPVFGASGQLLARPGYHAADRLWYAHDGLVLEDVPIAPIAGELHEAVSLVADLLVDFDFATESDRTHAVAALVLRFVRALVKGPTPLTLIEAAAPGTGKSLLASVISTVVIGRVIEPTTFESDEAETRKKITTLLQGGAEIIAVDNVRNGIDSAAWAAALTSEWWRDRALGSNSEIVVPNTATWIATANNPRVTTEIARRVARVRLQSRMERPQDRAGFTHPKILEWAADNRAELVRAVLVMVRAWQAAGSPAGKGTLGSYESWVEVVGGIVQHAGFGGFLESSRELYELADVEGSEWRAFVAGWYRVHKDAVVKSSDLVALAVKEELLGSVVNAEASARAQQSKLGRALLKMRDRVFDVDGQTVKLTVKDDDHTKAKVYRLAGAAQ